MVSIIVIWHNTRAPPYCNIKTQTKQLMPKYFNIVTVNYNVLYGCETWSLTLREERRLRVFETRCFRRIFGPKMDEVTGELRKLHIEELNVLY